MANALFDPGREGFGIGEIDWDTATIKASLLRGYTINAAHKFVSDITGAGGTLAATQTLTSKTGNNGVLDAADPVFPAVAAGAALDMVLIYQASAVGGGGDVAAGSQRVIGILDGRVPVTTAVAASSGATSIAVDPLPRAIASGSTVAFTGGVTATLTAGAAVGDRVLAVSAISGAIAQNVAGVSSPQGLLPITPNGGDLTVTFDNGANKIFRL